MIDDFLCSQANKNFIIWVSVVYVTTAWVLVNFLSVILNLISWLAPAPQGWGQISQRLCVCVCDQYPPLMMINRLFSTFKGVPVMFLWCQWTQNFTWNTRARAHTHTKRPLNLSRMRILLITSVESYKKKKHPLSIPDKEITVLHSRKPCSHCGRGVRVNALDSIRGTVPCSRAPPHCALW